MGFWSGLGKALGVAGSVVAAPFTGGGSLAALGPILSAGGQAAGAVANAQANNRGEQFGGQSDLARLLLARDQLYQNQLIAKQQADQSGTSDAWKKLLSTQHTLSPAAHTQLSPYSVAPRMSTPDEQAGASALSQQVLARLQGGSTLPTPQPTNLGVDPNLLKPGTGESLAGWLAALGPLAGTLLKPQQPTVMSGIPTGAPRA